MQTRIPPSATRHTPTAPDRTPARAQLRTQLPARKRPRSAPAFRPPCPECPPGIRSRRSLCATANETNSSQSSPAPQRNKLALPLNPFSAHVHHKAIKSSVGNQQVASAAEHEKLQPVLTRPVGRLDDVVLVSASTNQRAGPPIPRVVNGASG